MFFPLAWSGHGASMGVIPVCNSVFMIAVFLKVIPRGYYVLRSHSIQLLVSIYLGLIFVSSEISSKDIRCLGR